jgi:NADPH2:quinone reductase
MFRWIAEGKLKIRIDKVYQLVDAAQAHRDLEGGHKTTGKLVLQPRAEAW